MKISFLKKEVISKLPKNYFIVGSIAQRKEYPNDIDIITTEQLDQVLKFFQEKFNVVSFNLYTSILNLSIKIDNFIIPINIWKATDKNLIYMVFGYSYPANFVKRLRHLAKLKNYKLSQYYFIDDEGTNIPVKNFNDFFRVFQSLGYDLPFRSPFSQYLKEEKNEYDINDNMHSYR